MLLGFLEPGTCLGTWLTDIGCGTFTLSGTPVTDQEALQQMDLPDHETSVEVLKGKESGRMRLIQGNDFEAGLTSGESDDGFQELPELCPNHRFNSATSTSKPLDHPDLMFDHRSLPHSTAQPAPPPQQRALVEYTPITSHRNIIQQTSQKRGGATPTTPLTSYAGWTRALG